ncbi:hypothetical protein M9H77_29998 [Catharanthus roseus]|uniref:Uncharacterized protein n=1 Tax=Catharanthus roseus TaxID=4058 RepID=A0ACB9ZWD3_CATRO|nr:hypothetical protein M9H77_29998 [Catharanthus roseus]
MLLTKWAFHPKKFPFRLYWSKYQFYRVTYSAIIQLQIRNACHTIMGDKFISGKCFIASKEGAESSTVEHNLNQETRKKTSNQRRNSSCSVSATRIQNNKSRSVPSGSRKDKKTKTDRKRQKRNPSAKQPHLPSPVGAEDGQEVVTRDLLWTVGLTLPSTVRFSFVQDLLSWIQELKALIQDFILRLGDSRDDLRRRCLELKKEEQSRATDWGLIGAID